MPALFIDKGQTISSVQRQFNKIFPYLKLEFFQQPPVAGIGNSKNKMIVFDMYLLKLQKVNYEGTIDFNGSTTVSELENEFARQFGLFVQVFRKSGKVWLETTATDNWTLEQQNEEGKSLESFS